jgi:hypothetical protein
MDWKKMKSFGVDRERQIVLKDWTQKLPLYVANKNHLYDVRKVTLEFSKSPKGNAGARFV